MPGAVPDSGDTTQKDKGLTFLWGGGQLPKQIRTLII